MEGTALLQLPEGMLVDQIQITESGLVIEIVAEQYDLVLVARREERLRSLATKLHHQFHVDPELMGTGVRVQALCPGFTHTEFHDQPVYEPYHLKDKNPKALWMSADEVVEQSLKALKQGRVICIPGFKNRVLVALARSPLKPLLLKLLEKRLRN